MNFSKMMVYIKFWISGVWGVRLRRWFGVQGASRPIVHARAIEKYARGFIPALRALPDDAPINDDANEKIFTIWQQGEENAPELVKACFRSIRRHCKQELVVLDDNNLSEYIQLPPEIIAKYRAGKMGRAHFSDICRVELLYKYGGIWMDATCFVTAPIPDWVLKHDFFMFLASESGRYAFTFCQSCFIRARRGSYLIAAWRAMLHQYWAQNNSNMDYFLLHLLFKALIRYDARAAKCFANMAHVCHDNTHLVWEYYRNAPFDKKLFDDLTGHIDGFFQKTSYKADISTVPGTFADVMINHMNKQP